MSRFDYVKYDDLAQVRQAAFKDQVEYLENLICGNFHNPACGRAKALALTALEECYMWIGKAIRDDQIARNGSAELQEERKNG